MLDIRRETAKPLWDRQLALYIDAAECAATIATTRDEAARRKAEDRFWVLYWGPLAVVEDVGLSVEGAASVEAAMVAFGNALRDDPKSDRLTYLSLDLAHAIRKAIAPAFNVKAAPIVNHGARNRP